jgi:hypothetical protein
MSSSRSFLPNPDILAATVRPRSAARCFGCTALSLTLLFCSGFGAHAGTTPLFPKAIVRTEDIELAIKTEWEQRKNYDLLAKEGDPWFAVIDGTSHVLMSAPHATAQMREGKSKFADAGTGALAIMLNRLAKTTVIYTTRQSPSDPNFYDDNDYKKTLASLVDKEHPKLVLDLHASHWYRPYDVDFGTMSGESLQGHSAWLRRLSECFAKAGLRDFSQDYFSASTNQTVTKFVQGKGVPCIQLEFNETWLNLFNEVGIKSAGDSSADISEDILRVDQNGAHRFSSTLEALVRFIGWLDQHTSRDR